jgi:glycosyltransferase involved in cell wall biosynthesis
VPIYSSWCNFVFADEEKEFETTSEIMNAMAGYQSQINTFEKFSVKEIPNRPAEKSLVARVKQYASFAPAIARKNKHSIIHAHDWLTYLAGISARKASGKPLVAHVHATEFDRSGSDNVNSEIADIEYKGLNDADMVVTVSERTKKQIIKKYGVAERKVNVVYNGTEFNFSENIEVPSMIRKLKEKGASIVLFAGRITIQKGPDYFVALADKVLKFEPNTFFVVSGNGDMEEKMLQEVASRGIANNFVFCGFLRGDELAQVYKSADIYVMPSVSEPFGLLPLEVMLTETPVLVSKESGVSEIIKNALKSHFWDVDDMTDKVISVIRNKNLKQHLRHNGREEARTIHWGKAANSLVSLYNSLALQF